MRTVKRVTGICRTLRPLGLLAVVVVAACSAPSPTVQLPRVNGPLQVVKGEQLTISLEANPTTGFAWELAAPLDTKVVALVSHDYQRSDAARVGAGGTDVWVFKAIGAGSTTIALEYRRPWEKDSPPADRKTYPIVVR